MNEYNLSTQDIFDFFYTATDIIRSLQLSNNFLYTDMKTYHS